MAKLKDTTITGGLDVSGEVTISSPIAYNNPATKQYVDDIIFNLPTTLTISPSNFESQTAKTILAAPSAEDGVPTFREIIAEDIAYDNSASGLESQTVKDALDELSADIITSTPEAIDITTDTAQFTTILSSADTNVQHALETLDKHTHALPVASTTVLGAVKVGSGLSITNEVLSVTNPGYTSQAAKTFLAAPTATAGIPTFREIIAADIPLLNQNTSGNAATATKLGTTTVGSTQLPIYLNAGTATAITQANLRIGLFGATAIGSASQPVYFAANGVPTAITETIGNNTTGSAASLTTARTLTIGSTGKNFDGSADVSWTLSDIGLVTTFDGIPNDTTFPSAKLVYDAINGVTVGELLEVDGGTI